MAIFSKGMARKQPAEPEPELRDFRFLHMFQDGKVYTLEMNQVTTEPARQQANHFKYEGTAFILYVKMKDGEWKVLDKINEEVIHKAVEQGKLVY